MDQPPLLQSRKFWIMVVDIVVSVSGYFITKYANPAAGADALFLIGSLQPVILFVVGSMTVQNVEGIRANAQIETSKNYNAALTTSEKQQ
jgi:hypothetical protein